MGSRAGIPNKNKQTLLKLLEARYPDYHPVTELVDIALDLNNDVNVRLNANKEVAQYIVPKLKSIELTGANGEPIKTDNKYTVEIVAKNTST